MIVMWTLLGVCRSQGSLFEPIFFSQGCIFGKKFLSQGYIFLPKSLAKGIFFMKPPRKWHLGAKLAPVFGKFLLKREFLVHDQEMLLSQGYVFDQNFLSQGYPIKNRSRTPPSKFFLSTPPPPPPQVLSILWVVIKGTCLFPLPSQQSQV